MASRVLAASLGGFAASSALALGAAALFSHIGWLPRPQAVHVATLAGYLVWVGLALWCFHSAGPERRVWAWLIGLALLGVLPAMGLHW